MWAITHMAARPRQAQGRRVSHRGPDEADSHGNILLLFPILIYCGGVNAHRDERPAEDLTARARIRDAALEVFAERGAAGARLKDVAEAAGVSIGLVQHHFGTKEELRRACDQHVMETVVRGAADGVADPEALAALLDGSERGIRYLARALVDGTPAAAAFFSAATGVTAEFLSASWPERFPAGSPRARAAAAAMTAMHTSTIVMHEHLSRELGVDVLARENTVLGVAISDVYAAMGEFAETAAGRNVAEAIAERTEESE